MCWRNLCPWYTSNSNQYASVFVMLQTTWRNATGEKQIRHSYSHHNLTTQLVLHFPKIFVEVPKLTYYTKNAPKSVQKSRPWSNKYKINQPELGLQNLNKPKLNLLTYAKLSAFQYVYILIAAATVILSKKADPREYSTWLSFSWTIY